jgi:hypothetical protein
MIFASFWHVRIEVFVKLYSPFARKIPLNPPFSKGEINHDNYFPLFEKEGPGEILDKCQF